MSLEQLNSVKIFPNLKIEIFGHYSQIKNTLQEANQGMRCNSLYI